MEPAYQIPLNEKELALVGELTVILGQVDEIMIRTVARLLGVDRPAANVIMGSSKVADNAAIWDQSIRNRIIDPDILWLVSHALSEIQTVSAGRNDFIHAWFEAASGYFGNYFGNYFGGYFGEGPITARRVRSPDKMRPISDLVAIRDQAARLSCLVAHIDHLIENPATVSPWLERLAPSLPPRPPPDAIQQRGKGRRRQRKS